MEIVSCNICGSNENILLFSRRDLSFGENKIMFNVVKCKECGLIFTNPRPTEEEMYLYYPDEYYYFPIDKNKKGFLISLYYALKRKLLNNYYGYNFLEKGYVNSSTISDIFLRSLDLIFKLFRRDILLFPFKKDGKLLDVGCGSGQTLFYWKEMGWKIYGVEVSHTAVRFAKEHFNLDIFKGTLFEAKYENKYFDVIMFNNTLEHMHDPTGVLLEAKRILKDEGLLIISVPNTTCIDEKLFGRYWSPWELPRHLYHFNRETIKKILQRTGFYPVKMTSDFVPQNTLLNLSFYLKHYLHLRLYPKFLLPFTIPWAYFGQGNVLFVHAKKIQDFTKNIL